MLKSGSQLSGNQRDSAGNRIRSESPGRFWPLWGIRNGPRNHMLLNTIRIWRPCFEIIGHRICKRPKCSLTNRFWPLSGSEVGHEIARYLIRFAFLRPRFEIIGRRVRKRPKCSLMGRLWPLWGSEMGPEIGRYLIRFALGRTFVESGSEPSAPQRKSAANRIGSESRTMYLGTDGIRSSLFTF